MKSITVVIYRETESSPFEARVLQEHQFGPNLSPKTGNPVSARQAAERRLRAEGWKGGIDFIEGKPTD